MTGQCVDANAAPPTLEARGVTKRFGAFTALKGVDLLVRPGEVTALAGPNGAGKTTLFHVLNGNLRPDSGKVLFNGADVTGMPPWKMARRGVGRLFQDVRAFGELTARENVEVALAAVGDRRDEAGFWLDYAGLDAKAKLRAKELSFVERKLLALARLMALRARLLLLDEPTAALPPDETEKVCAFVRRLADEQHVSVALVEHNVDVVKRYADTVCFLHEGEVLTSGPAAEVFADGRVAALYVGDDAGEKSGRVKFVSSSAGVRDEAGRILPGVAYLREEGNVFPSLSVRDNLDLATWGADRVAAAARKERALKLFPFLAERMGQRAGTLSGGQRQALAIAMTTCRDARAYFFDEPSAGLAPQTAAKMHAAIAAFAEADPDREVTVKESK